MSFILDQVGFNTPYQIMYTLTTIAVVLSHYFENPVINTLLVLVIIAFVAHMSSMGDRDYNSLECCRKLLDARRPAAPPSTDKE
jgi:hypothetical protein